MVKVLFLFFLFNDLNVLWLPFLASVPPSYGAGEGGSEGGGMGELWFGLLWASTWFLTQGNERISVRERVWDFCRSDVEDGCTGDELERPEYLSDSDHCWCFVQDHTDQKVQ